MEGDNYLDLESEIHCIRNENGEFIRVKMPIISIMSLPLVKSSNGWLQYMFTYALENQRYYVLLSFGKKAQNVTVRHRTAMYGAAVRAIRKEAKAMNAFVYSVNNLNDMIPVDMPEDDPILEMVVKPPPRRYRREEKEIVGVVAQRAEDSDDDDEIDV